jgi:hypothetical protein
MLIAFPFSSNSTIPVTLWIVDMIGIEKLEPDYWGWAVGRNSVPVPLSSIPSSRFLNWPVSAHDSPLPDQINPFLTCSKQLSNSLIDSSRPNTARSRLKCRHGCHAIRLPQEHGDLSLSVCSRYAVHQLFKTVTAFGIQIRSVFSVPHSSEK